MGALLLVALGLLGCLSIAEPDTYWHLRSGHDIVATGHVSLVDHYSFTADGQFWPNHEWLWQVVTYLVHAAGGMPLLAGMAAVLIVGTMGLLYRLTVGPLVWRLVLIGLAIFESGAPWSVRPHLFTHFAVVATLWAVVRGRLWPLPLLFVAWTNVHGAVVLGLVVLAGALLVAALERDGRNLRRLAATTLLCGAATLASPLGTRLYAFIGASMEKSRLDGVLEWRPTSFDLAGLPFLVAGLVLVALAIGARRRLTRREDRIIVVVALLMIPLGLRAVRNVALFWLLFAAAASRLLVAAGIVAARAPSPAKGPDDTPAKNVRDVVVIAAIAAIAVGWAWSVPLRFLNWNPMSAEAVAAVRACPGHVFNQYGDGGLLLWFVPEKPVFIDGRQDPYPIEFLERALTMSTSPLTRRAVFADYDMHCAALSAESSFASTLVADGWHERFRDARWVVLGDR
jgi:hypothetical protein